jgi:putative membrane protein
MGAAIASALHVLALAIGLPSVFLRGRALKAAEKGGPLEPVLDADNIWGIAALLWIGSGLWRLLGGLEKPFDWYLSQPAFYTKAALFSVLMGLETWPMVVFIRWRIAMAKGGVPDRTRVPLFRAFTVAETVGVVLMVFAAAAMARGLGGTSGQEGFCGVQQLVQARCTKCHGTVLKQAGLDMQGDPYGHLVGVHSTQWPAMLRVSPGRPQESLMMLKLTGHQGVMGAAMPAGETLSSAETGLVERWIADGAPPCSGQ